MNQRLRLFVLWVLVALPSVGLADALIPYLWVPVGQLFLFPVVVLVEAVVIWRVLGRTFGRSLITSLRANLASTAAGAALYFSSMPLIGESLWNFWLKYRTPAAFALSFAVALVLFFLSWFLEGYVILKREPEVGPILAKRASAFANLSTYIPLLLLSFAGA